MLNFNEWVWVFSYSNTTEDDNLFNLNNSIFFSAEVIIKKTKFVKNLNIYVVLQNYATGSKGGVKVFMTVF